MPDDKKSKIGKVWAKITRKDKDPEARLGRMSRYDFGLDRPEGSTSRQGVQEDWDDNRSSDDLDTPGANLNPRQDSPRRNHGTRWPDSSEDEFEAQDPWRGRRRSVNSMDHMQDSNSMSTSSETREPVPPATHRVRPTSQGRAQRVQRRLSSESEIADRINHNVPRRENTRSPAAEDDDEDDEDPQFRLAMELSLQVNEDEELERALELSRIEAEQRSREQVANEELVANIMEISRVEQRKGRWPRPLEKTVEPAQRSHLTPQSPVESPRPVVSQRSTPNVRPPVERPHLSTQHTTPNIHLPAEKPRLGLATQRITPKSRPLVDSPSQATPTKPSSADSPESIDFETRVAMAESLRTASLKHPIETETSRGVGLPGAWHYNEDDGRYNTSRRFDPPARRPASQPDEESDDDIYGPPVIESSVPTQNLNDDIYGSPGTRVEPEHAISLSASQDGPSLQALSHSSSSQSEVEPQIESNMFLVEETIPLLRVPTPVLSNEKQHEEPFITNVEPSESQTTVNDRDTPAKSLASSNPLPADEEIPKPPSPLNVVETASELPTDERSNSPNQSSHFEPFRILYETALQTFRPLQSPNISSVSNPEQMRSVPIVGHPSGQQADQETHTGDNVEGTRPVDLSPTRHIGNRPLSTTLLAQSSPRDRSVPASPASTSPPTASVRVPPPPPVKPVNLQYVRPSVASSPISLSYPSTPIQMPPTSAPRNTESVRASPHVEPINITPTRPIIIPSYATSSSTPRDGVATSSPASLPPPTEPIPVAALANRTFLPALETSAEALDHFIPPKDFDVIARRPQSTNVIGFSISVSQEERATPATHTNPSSNDFPTASFSPIGILALTEPNVSQEYSDSLISSTPFLPANIFGLSEATPEHAPSTNYGSSSTIHPTHLIDAFRPSETNATTESSAYAPFPSSLFSPVNIPGPSETRIANHVLPDDDPFPSTSFSPISIFALSGHNIDHSYADDEFPTTTFSFPSTSAAIVSEYDASSNTRGPRGQPFSNALESEIQSGSASLFPQTTDSSINVSTPTGISRNTFPYEPNFSSILSEPNVANDGRDDDARSIFIPPASWNQPAVFDDPRLDTTVPPTFDVSAILSQSTLSRNDGSNEHSSSSDDPLSGFVPSANLLHK